MISENPDFTAYAVGFVFASVCTSLTDAEATERLNLVHPTGISSRWSIADEPFRTGEPNGCPCNDRPDTHRHILFAC
jgi:hypothetical protein